MARFVRTQSRAVIAAPRDISQRLAHPEWFHITKGKGGGTESISVNVLRIPKPERSLVANITAVSVEGRNATLVFGQHLPGASSLYGALCVQMSVPALDQTFANSGDFMRELDGFAERHKITKAIRSPDPTSYPKERVVLERASLISITFSEDEAELRFYRVSPAELRTVSQDGDEKAELIHPVVEVMMATEELVQLVHTVEQALP